MAKATTRAARAARAAREKMKSKVVARNGNGHEVPRKAMTKKPTHRSYRVTIPASEATLLEALADEDGLSPAAWIRQATVMRVRAVEGFQKVGSSASSPSAEADATSERTS